LEKVENRVLVVETVAECGRSWVLISLERGMYSPNLDITDRPKYNTAIAPYLEYYYPKYSHEPRYNWDEYILVEPDTELLRDQGRIN
jgi:hypothetical protein